MDAFFAYAADLGGLPADQLKVYPGSQLTSAPFVELTLLF